MLPKMADFEDYFLFVLDNYFRIYVWPCSTTEKLELHQLWINGLLRFLLDVGRDDVWTEDSIKDRVILIWFLHWP
ncbi:unnamed protein product [Boreogadus saida]